MNKSKIINLNNSFIKLVNRYNEIESQPFFYGTDTLLYTSEVHTIEAIGNNPDVNITQLAKLQGITKGAISKRIQKLIQKDLVTKSFAPQSENEVVLNLTNKGIKAFKGHEAYSQKFNNEISKLCEIFSKNTLEELELVGNEIEKMFIQIYNERILID